jgi:hypothetical protein
MSPIHTDGADDFSPLTESEAADAFFKLSTPTKPDADGPSGAEEEDTEQDTELDADDEDSEETLEDEAEGEEEGDEEDADEEDDDEGDTEKKYADDDATFVKIKVGDEEHEVPVKDLKRLYGQEAALTRKSQEVAERRKAVDAEGAAYVAATSVLLQRAQERYEPFTKLNFLALAKDPTVSAKDIAVLQEQAQAAYEDVQFLQNSMGQFVRELEKRQNAELVEQAKEAIKVLSDPEKGIEGWNQKLYDDIRSFAVSNGLHPEVVNKLVDPAAIKLIHKAMLYERGAKAATKKVVKTPKKVVKRTQAPEVDAKRKSGATRIDAAMKNLKARRDTAAAADAFFALTVADSDD